MYDQDYELDVINDCNYFENNPLGYSAHQYSYAIDDMDMMHKSAPDINKLRSTYSYEDHQNDFVFNSCQSVQDYRFYVDGIHEDISYQDDSEDMPYQAEDIFDRIDDLHFDHNNSSLLQENQDSTLQLGLRNQSNLSLDLAFNFDLNINTNKSQFLATNSYTDRLSLSFNGQQFSSHSLEKRRKEKYLEQMNFTNLKIRQFEKGKQDQICRFKKKENTSNKKKYQPFTEYVKQSKILGEILPSNNMNDSLFTEKSFNIKEKDCEKSVIAESVLCKNQNKQKLLKKIDKLLFSKTKNKRTPMISKRINLNEQRKQLKAKKTLNQDKNKENFRISEDKQFSRTPCGKAQQSNKFIRSGIKMFKRSQKKSQIPNQKAKQTRNQSQNNLLELNFKQESNVKKNLNFSQQKGKKIERKQIKHKDQQELNQIFTKQSNLNQFSSSLKQFERILSPSAYKIIFQLSQIYQASVKQSSSKLNDEQILDKVNENTPLTNFQAEQKSIPSLQYQINSKYKQLKTSEQQMTSTLGMLNDKLNLVKNTLHSAQTLNINISQSYDGFPSQTLVTKNINKISHKKEQTNQDQLLFEIPNSLCPFKTLCDKRKQLKNNYYFWSQLDL